MARKARLYLFFAVILACAFGFARPALAASFDTSPRHFDASYPGPRVTLGPDWLFSASDNPAYALPAYDDTAWRTVSANRMLASYGIRDIPYVWYRIHVHLPPGARNLAMELQHIQGSYEVYANGARIGAEGRMSGVREFFRANLISFDIPDSALTADGDLLLALRFELNRVDAMDTSVTPFGLGTIFIASRDAAPRDASYEMAHRNSIPFILCVLYLVVGMVALALYWAMRSQMEYLAIAISLLATSLQSGIYMSISFHGFTVAVDFLGQLALGVANVALIEFVRLILQRKRTQWLLAVEIANFLGYFSETLVNSGVISPVPSFILYFFPALTAKMVMLVMLVNGLRRGNRDARVILPAIAVVSLGDVWQALSAAGDFLGIPLYVPPMPYFHFGSYGMSFWSMWFVIYCVTILLFLVLRTIGIAQERARIAGELESARQVQAQLVPVDFPRLSGFQIEAAYVPASEVGGDFYQVLEQCDGSLLIVIGDVCGKGLKAAMTGVLAIGAVRALASQRFHPGWLLTRLNREIARSQNGGFITCVCACISRDGAIVLANAGHPPPYRNGEEIQLNSSLPLGITPNVEYSETRVQLASGDRLTFLSDGVVEARSNADGLFGFDRVQAISEQSAQTIANAAKQFGQEDDITVLTVSFMTSDLVPSLDIRNSPADSFGLAI